MEMILEKDVIVNNFHKVKDKVEKTFGDMMPTDKKEKIFEKAVYAQFEYPEWDMEKCVIFGYECMLQDSWKEVSNGIY